ncbi:MAG: hypothetical protein RIS45_984 [Planctomycetota bacterium]|jgi:hypothetical protein
MVPAAETARPLAAVGEAGSLLAVIARAAADPAVDVGKMERLMQMHRDELARQAAQAYAEGLVRVQRAMPTVHKDRTNTQTNSNYATLEAVNRAITPIYTAEGFALSFGTEDSPLAEHVRIVCDVIHRDGHSRRYFYDAPMDGHGIGGKVNKTPTHARGSAISYGRRYLTNLIFNLTTSDEDDDGNAATGSQDDDAASKVANWRAAIDECNDVDSLKARKKEMNDAYAVMVPPTLVQAYNARLKALKG